MITEIRAPKTGLTAETLQIVKWHKKEGEFVDKEELLVTVETEKTTLDIVSPLSGFLKKINFQAGESAAVSQVIGYLADSTNDSLGEPESDKLLVSPVARKIAAEHQVQLSEIEGSGPNGRIQKSDVERYIKQQALRHEVSIEEEDRGGSSGKVLSDSMRRRTAEATTKSKTTIPHYYLFSSFDVTNMLEQRQRQAQGGEIKPSIITILVKACAVLIEKYPALNRVWDRGAITDRSDISVGFVVKTDAGIIIPHICNAHRMSMTELEQAVRALIEKAKELELPAEVLQAGTMSISNLGMYPVDCFVPIIYPSEAGMMGIGQIKKSAVWNGAEFVPRDIMAIVLALDHRLIDGAEAAEFIQGLKDMIEGTDPSYLLQ
jgi:pyruvate dehydrogenase E2 component (dihydrolipoamide acetyltransferase)